MLRNVLLLLLMGAYTQGFNQPVAGLQKKVSPSLRRHLDAKGGNDSITVSVSAKAPFLFPKLLRQQPSLAPYLFYTGKIAVTDLPVLVRNDAILFVSESTVAKEEINTGVSDPSLNQISYARHRYPHLAGKKLVVSVKERMFDTTDIDLKKRIIQSGLEHTVVTAHASLMATIIAGAGNSSPFAKGAAPAAFVSAASFSNLFPDADTVFRRDGVSVQNHSYGTAVENFYGNEASAYDQSAINHPTLLYVFSAGNAGNTTPTAGGYSGVSQMANLTGNFKQAKNIITVSGVDSVAGLLPLSSRGPAYDGRLKPELVAYGEDGSSGAAALTSGTALLVQDIFRQQNGHLPPADLTKAVLLNSADDVGANGIDYLSGYGSLNAFKAVQTIADRRFLRDSIAKNSANVYSVSVTANVKQLKLTLVWTDPPAPPNAAKALVNDLDFILKSPDGITWLPWVLPISPDKNALLQPAQRKKDTLNNVEQISLDNPVPGLYTIEVKSGNILSARQAFALAWQADTTGTFYWTFPTASDHLLSGRRQTVRWQTNNTIPGKIEYTANGLHWQLIGTVDTLSINSLKWNVPDTVTLAQLRLVSNNQIFYSDTFSITPQVNLQTGFNCADSFLLYWPRIKADSYRLYRLGEMYLEPVTVTTDTFALFSTNRYPSPFYTLAPIVDGKEGLRGNTAYYAAQGVGCYLRSFYLQSQTVTTAILVAELGTVYNVAAVALEKWSGSGFRAIQTITGPQTTAFTFTGVPLHPGENRFRISVQLVNGLFLHSNVEVVYTVSEEAPVFVYPNPLAAGHPLTVLTREVGRYTVLFYDATGKLLLQKELTNSVTLLPVNTLAKGLYFLKIHDKRGRPQILRQIIL